MYLPLFVAISCKKKTFSFSIHLNCNVKKKMKKRMFEKEEQPVNACT